MVQGIGHARELPGRGVAHLRNLAQGIGRPDPIAQRVVIEGRGVVQWIGDLDCMAVDRVSGELVSEANPLLTEKLTGIFRPLLGVPVKGRGVLPRESCLMYSANAKFGPRLSGNISAVNRDSWPR